MATSFPADVDRLTTDLDALRVEHGVAGFAVTLVTPDGQRNLVGGVADRPSARPVTPDTLFRIGSITKTFNALALLMLVEEGRLDLHTPLLDIAPDAPLENRWREERPVRISHLLEQTSGLLDITREEFDHNRPFASLEAAFAFQPQARVVQWPPGLHSVYSNANAGYVGLVIERLSSQSYERFLTERVLDPLGMASSSLTDDTATRERLATGYDTDGVTRIPYWHMIFPPLGAINATPREMGALVRVFLDRGTSSGRHLLAETSIERMEIPTTTLGGGYGLTYGYGLGLDQSVHKGSLWYGHTGDGDGYLSHFGYNRDAGAGYFLTINAFNHEALNAMKARVQDFLTRGVAAPEPTAATIDLEALPEITGDYVAVTRRFEWQDPARLDEDRIQVVLDDGALYTQTANRRRRLIPVDTHLFRREDQPIATIAIVPYDGEMFLQGDFGNYRRLP